MSLIFDHTFEVLFSRETQSVCRDILRPAAGVTSVKTFGTLGPLEIEKILLDN